MSVVGVSLVCSDLDKLIASWPSAYCGGSAQVPGVARALPAVLAPHDQPEDHRSLDHGRDYGEPDRGTPSLRRRSGDEPFAVRHCNTPACRRTPDIRGPSVAQLCPACVARSPFALPDGITCSGLPVAGGMFPAVPPASAGCHLVLGSAKPTTDVENQRPHQRESRACPDLSQCVTQHY